MTLLRVGRICGLFGAIAMLMAFAGAHQPASCANAMSSSPEARMRKAALALLATLSPDQRSKAVFAFNSDERLSWHYVPIERKGLALGELTEPQRERAFDLIRCGLSARGFEKTEIIRRLETVLIEIEKGTGPRRDPERYFITIFGQPAARGAWGWRYEGHHISLNWTVADGKVIASSPQFLGANPAEVRFGAMKGTRALPKEEDLARSLLGSLSPAQRGEAILSGPAPADIITSSRRKAAILEDAGISYGHLTPEQQGTLLSLIREHAGTQAETEARRRLDGIRKEGLSRIKFAWMGGVQPGQGHYYRIQGPTFLIEFDNTQNEANHIHSVWRDFHGDFGADLLEMHYLAYHSAPERR
jgi:hypothetical protein